MHEWTFVQAWVKHRWRLKVQEPVPEPAGIPLHIQGQLAMEDVDVVILVGLPGESSLVHIESATFSCSKICQNPVCTTQAPLPCGPAGCTKPLGFPDGDLL